MFTHKLHNHLSSNLNWYNRYHRWNYHHHIHWLVLAMYIIGTFSFGYTSLYDVPRVQAAELSATLVSGFMPNSASYTAPPTGSNTSDAVYNIGAGDTVTSYSFTLTCSGPTLASPRWKVYTSSNGSSYSEIDTLDCQGDIPISGGSATIEGVITGSVYYIKLSAIAQSAMLPGTYTVIISDPHLYGTSSDPAPTVAISSPSNNCVGDKHYTRSSSVTVSGSAADTAPGTVSSVTVNGGSATGTTSWSKSGVSLASEGNNTITAIATDNASQASSPASITVYRDTTAPSVSISSPAEGTVTSSSTATISGTASDNSGGSGLSSVSSSTGSSVSGTSSWSTTVNLSSGSNTITITATDCAGNTATQSVGIVYQSGGGGGDTDTVTKSITVVTPNGGENYLTGVGTNAVSTTNITWTTQNISTSEKIKLSYTTNNSTYTTIADNESNDSSYSWTLPSTKSTTVKVKAELTTDASVSDTSNSNFELHSNSAPGVNI